MSALGLDYSPWNLRNLLLPRIVVDPFLRFGELFGLTDGTSVARLGTIPFLLAATLNSWLVFLIGRRLFDEQIGLAAAAVHGLHWLTLVFGSTVYPRTMTTLAVLIACYVLWQTDEAGGNLRRGILAGLCCALAFSFRYSEGIFALPLILGLWALPLRPSSRWIRALSLVGGFCVGALFLVGLGELWTSGGFGTNFAEFFRYTLIEREASSEVAVQPVTWYLRRLPYWLLPTLLPFLFAAREKPALAIWLCLLVPLLILTAIHHKDLRYLQGIVPFLAILIGVGATKFWRSGWKKTTVALVVLALAFSVRTGFRHLERKSLAAVEAAEYLSKQSELRSVALSQAWAYGHMLYFGNDVGLVDLGVPPSQEELAVALPKVDRVALYADDLNKAPRLRETLDQANFILDRKFEEKRSKEVLVFKKYP